MTLPGAVHKWRGKVVVVDPILDDHADQHGKVIVAICRCVSD